MTTKGRTPPELPSLILPSSGIAVKVHPLGRFLLDEIGKAARKALPEPEPPRNTVPGLDGSEHEEPNTADPDYQAALAARNDMLASEVVMRILRASLAYGAIEYVADGKAVARLRKAMDAAGVTIEGDDAELYFWHVMLRDDEDLQALTGAVMRMSTVTEEAVADRVAEF